MRESKQEVVNEQSEEGGEGEAGGIYPRRGVAAAMHTHANEQCVRLALVGRNYDDQEGAAC